MSGLTVQQLAVICTGKVTPPWHLKDVAGVFTMFKKTPLSLVALRDEIEQSRMVFYLQIRDGDILKKPQSLEDFQTNWAKAVPSKKTLEDFEQFLEPSGASMTYLSPDWRTIAVYGTCTQLASVNLALTSVADVVSGLANIGDSAIGIAAAFGLAGSAAPPAAPLLFTVGAGFASFGAGVKLTLGLYQVFEDSGISFGTTTAVVGPPTSFDPTQVIGSVGQPPPSSNASGPSPTTPVDVGSAPPPTCPVTPLGPVSPTCPVGPTSPTGSAGGQSVCPDGF